MIFIRVFFGIVGGGGDVETLYIYVFIDLGVSLFIKLNLKRNEKDLCLLQNNKKIKKIFNFFFYFRNLCKL